MNQTKVSNKEEGVQLCLDVHEGQFGPWLVTHTMDQDVRRLMDDHYSRQSKGNPKFCRPGDNLVFRTYDASAAWISWRGIGDDGQEDVWECSAFRNNSSESGYLSSEMIHWAVYATICRWHDKFPAKGIITYVDQSKVLSTNPGYCFKEAGFSDIGRSKKRGLLLLHHPLERSYLAKRAAFALREVDFWVRTALESGEYMEAYSLFKDGNEHTEFLQHLQHMIQDQRLHAWEGIKDCVMSYWELMNIISPYEELTDEELY